MWKYNPYNDRAAWMKFIQFRKYSRIGGEKEERNYFGQKRLNKQPGKIGSTAHMQSMS